MSFFEKAKGFYESKKKPIIAIGSSALAVLFVASVVIAVFCGGEFTKKDEKKKEVKGLLQIVNASYSVSYLDGDSFSFDKQTAEISLIARDRRVGLPPIPTFPRMPFIGRLCGKGGPSSRRRWMRGYSSKSIFAPKAQSICLTARYLPIGNRYSHVKCERKRTKKNIFK